MHWSDGEIKLGVPEDWRVGATEYHYFGFRILNMQ